MCSNCNISIDEFYDNYECINEDEDIWQNKKTNEKFKIIMEDETYVIGKFL